MADPNDNDYNHRRREYEREREDAFADANAWNDRFDYDDWEPPSTSMDD